MICDNGDFVRRDGSNAGFLACEAVRYLDGLPCVAVCCNVFESVAVSCRALQSFADCCGV